MTSPPKLYFFRHNYSDPLIKIAYGRIKTIEELQFIDRKVHIQYLLSYLEKATEIPNLTEETDIDKIKKALENPND